MTRLDALADPVRLALVRFLADRPGSAREIADGIGVHLNTARSHLGPLVEVGIVERTSERPRGRGRPVVRYRIKDGWRPVGDELLSLARLMATTLGRGGSQSLAAARHWGRVAVDRGTGSSQADLEEIVSALGYEARANEDELWLSNCPCPLVSSERPAAVCRLVDAAVDGALESRGLRAGARHHDPAARRCCIALATS